MIVLSLFDGMSCGQIALRELGIIPTIYYASEVDKHAIRQAQLNFPDTVQLGDVTRWQEWEIDWSKIDLLLAGSPCQGFSFAGKQLAFDDPRSRLFFVFIDILNHIRKYNPKVRFLLENVNMKREYMKVINDYCGLFPVNINSNLVSAQNRDRWYWSNIRTHQVGLFEEIHTNIPQPKDRGLLLVDILETDVAEKYYLNDKVLEYLLPKGKLKNGGHKAGCLTGGSGHGAGYHSDMDLICVAMRGRYSDNRTEQKLEPNQSGKTNCLTSVAKDNLIVLGNIYNNSQSGRVYSTEGKSATLSSEGGGGGAKTGLYLNHSRIRRLTPTECARLQTIPDWYIWRCSETQIYRMLGNGWTVEVIKHIFNFL